MRITVVGLGYVGLANALLLAQKNDVTGVDIAIERIRALKDGQSPLRDKEIEEYMQTTSAQWSTRLDSVANSDLVIISTPTDYAESTNYFDTSSVESVIASVHELNSNVPVLIKSTIPIGYVKKIRQQFNKQTIFFSPEFLREGKALYDNLHPSRIVVGDMGESGQMIAGLFHQAALNNPPVVLTDATEAEAIKLFSNAYLALRVAFFNELDTFSVVKGLDTEEIINGVSLDPRIGQYYNNPSFGYGGYCLPKDTRQLLSSYADVPNEIMTAIVQSNQTRKSFIASEIVSKKPNVVGIYHLAMKTGSDNYRVSAIQDIILLIQRAHVKTIIYDPSIEASEFLGCPVIKDFDDFAQQSSLIVANRREKALEPYKDKLYTRDIFQEDA
jgi:UDPglucose 6-dehydrogenase